MNKFERSILAGSAVAMVALAAAVLLKPRLDKAERIEPRQVLPGHTSLVQSVAFFPDNKTLFSAEADYGFRFWDADSGRLLHTESLFNIGATAFSPDGKTVVFLDGNRDLKLWDVSTGEQRTLMESDIYFRTVLFSPDGKRAAAAIIGRPRSSIRIWDVKSGALLQTIEGVWKFNSVAFSPDGKRVVGPGAGNSVKIWDVKTGKPLQTFHGHVYSATRCAYSTDGKTIASVDQNQIIKIWDVKTGKPLLIIDHKSVDALAYSPDGKTIAILSRKAVHIRDVKTGALLQKLLGLSGEYGGLGALAYSPDGKALAAADVDNGILIWDIKNASPR